MRKSSWTRVVAAGVAVWMVGAGAPSSARAGDALPVPGEEDVIFSASTPQGQRFHFLDDQNQVHVFFTGPTQNASSIDNCGMSDAVSGSSGFIPGTPSLFHFDLAEQTADSLAAVDQSTLTLDIAPSGVPGQCIYMGNVLPAFPGPLVEAPQPGTRFGVHDSISQSFVSVVHEALGRFSVGLAAVELDSACANTGYLLSERVEGDLPFGQGPPSLVQEIVRVDPETGDILQIVPLQLGNGFFGIEISVHESGDACLAHLIGVDGQNVSVFFADIPTVSNGAPLIATVEPTDPAEIVGEISLPLLFGQQVPGGIAATGPDTGVVTASNFGGPFEGLVYRYTRSGEGGAAVEVVRTTDFTSPGRPSVFRTGEGGSPDTDEDGVPDDQDNCVTVFNPILGTQGQPGRESFQTTTGGQLDDDADGFGNQCDAKFGTPGQFVGGVDIGEMLASFNKDRSKENCGSSGQDRCAPFDLDNAGQFIGGADVGAAFGLFNQEPGPKCAACPLACVGPACP